MADTRNMRRARGRSAGEMRDPFWTGCLWEPPGRTALCEPGHVLARSYDWRTRNGARVPAAECLPPPARVGLKAFAAAMEEMGAGPLDLGGELAPAP